MKKSLLHFFGTVPPGIWMAVLFVLSFICEAQAGKARIDLLGSDTVYLERCHTYQEPGYYLYDTGGVARKPTDPLSTFWTTSSPTFNNNHVGTFTITYHFIYDGDTAIPVNRWIIVAQDSTPPAIQLLGDDTVYVNRCSPFWTDPGATVIDLCDGDISYKLNKISNPALNLHVSGTYILKYYAWDTLGNYSDTLKRVVVVRDNIPPVIQLLGSDTVYVEKCHPWTDPGATASDTCDGNLTSQIVIASSPQLNVSVAGLYIKKYYVHDSDGNKSDTLWRWIIVVADSTAPELVVAGPEYDTISVGSSYTTLAVIKAQDTCDGNLISSVTVSNPVDVNVPGTYTVTYSVSDASSNTTVVYRYVTVLDTVFDLQFKVEYGNTHNGIQAAKVYLIQYDPVDTTLTAIDTTTITGGNNSFTFSDLYPGDYLVKVALDSTDSLYASYLPTYYDSFTTWSSARTLTLFDRNLGGTIFMIAGTNPGGPGFIGGKVTQGANKKEGDPIEGQEIVLTTKDGKPVAYTYSDANGNYKFTNLAYGDYKILGESEGKKAVAGFITLDNTNAGNENVDLIVKSIEIQTVIYTIKCSAKYTMVTNGGKVTFTGDNTLNPNLKYFWDFGDGTKGTGYNVTHEYTQDGAYNVCLKVDDSVKNCGDQQCSIVKISIPILGITGLVSADSATNSVATVWLMKHNTVTNGYDVTASQQIFLDNTASAYYQFDKLQAGEYLVKASLDKTSPRYRNAAPTYFPGNLKWKDATAITLTSDPKTDGDIKLLTTQEIHGKGIVTGHLRVGALKKEGDPIQNIAVLLLSESGNLVSFDITNANGEYSIPNIPNGKYEVYAEVAGMETFSKWIEITDDAFTFTEVNFSVQSTNIVTSIQDIPASVENISLFPNPTTNTLNLRLNMATSQQVKLTIVDMAGKVVIADNRLLTAGKHTLQFDLSALKTGTYTVNVQDASGRVVHGNFIRIE